MLPAAHRMRRSPDFERAVRRGRRAGRRTLVVHAARVGSGVEAPGDDALATAGYVPGRGVPGGGKPQEGRDSAVDRQREAVAVTRIGFVVSRSVGSAVGRNRVKRRLRALAADRLDRLPDDLLVVVRALPPASSASFAALGADLDAALTRVLGREASGTGTPGRSGGGVG